MLSSLRLLASDENQQHNRFDYFFYFEFLSFELVLTESLTVCGIERTKTSRNIEASYWTRTNNDKISSLGSIFIKMLILVFLAVQSHGLIEDSRFEVTKCSTADGQPELTFTIDESYFEQHLSSKADQDGLK